MYVCVGVYMQIVYTLMQAKKVIEMASAYDVMVIPHGSSVYSYHLQYAFTNCPMAEYMCLSEQVHGPI